MKEDRGKLDAKADEGDVMGENTRASAENNQHDAQDQRRDEGDSHQAQDSTAQPQRDTNPPHVLHNDPLEGFELSDNAQEPQREGQGQRLRKPSAYVQDIIVLEPVKLLVFGRYT